ncbi:MAG: hypothetical protein NZ482_05180 [Gloeomargarita sp. SKYG98]|nr:hypothetical protein [Gloeomargarita sp. SKYG98]
MDLPEIQYVAVYGRVYGQEEVEYEESLPLLKTPVTAPSTENPFVAAAAEPEPFTLSKYCFTRNRSLLTASLPSPKLSIAELIRDFHGFTDTEKQAILEELGKFLRNPDAVNTQTWSETMRAWLGRARSFSDEDMRSFAIWMSRYCANPEKTLETVQATIQAAKEAERERRRQEREARLAEPKGSLSVPSSRRSSVPPTATRSSSSHQSSVNSLTIAFSLLFLFTLTIGITIFGQAITLSISILSKLIFLLSLLGGWYLSLCNEVQFLIIGRMSAKALVTHIVLLVLALIPGTIVYFITLLFLPWVAYGLVGGLAGAWIGSICRSIVRIIGDPEEYELMKYARFRGLAMYVVGVSFLGILIATFGGFLLRLSRPNPEIALPRAKLDGFSEATCAQLVERVERERVTVEDVIDLLGDNATIETDILSGETTYTWDYANAKIVLATEGASPSAVVDRVLTCEQK